MFEMTNCDTSSGLLQKKTCTVSLIQYLVCQKILLNSRIIKPHCSKELNSGEEIKSISSLANIICLAKSQLTTKEAVKILIRNVRTLSSCLSVTYFNRQQANSLQQ